MFFQAQISEFPGDLSGQSPEPNRGMNLIFIYSTGLYGKRADILPRKEQKENAGSGTGKRPIPLPAWAGNNLPPRPCYGCLPM